MVGGEPLAHTTLVVREVPHAQENEVELSKKFGKKFLTGWQIVEKHHASGDIVSAEDIRKYVLLSLPVQQQWAWKIMAHDVKLKKMQTTF